MKHITRTMMQQARNSSMTRDGAQYAGMGRMEERRTEPREGMRSGEERTRNGMRRNDVRRQPTMDRNVYASADEDMEEEMEEFTREVAEHWTSEMENADGTKGAHWRMDQALSLMQQVGAHSDPHMFYGILNNTYRLYAKVAKKYGVDRADFYGEIAKAWIEDKDRMAEKCEKMIRKAKEK